MKNTLIKENEELRQELSKRDEERNKQLTKVLREIHELKEAQNAKRGWWPFERQWEKAAQGSPSLQVLVYD